MLWIYPSLGRVRPGRFISAIIWMNVSLSRSFSPKRLASESENDQNWSSYKKKEWCYFKKNNMTNCSMHIAIRNSRGVICLVLLVKK